MKLACSSLYSSDKCELYRTFSRHRKYATCKNSLFMYDSELDRLVTQMTSQKLKTEKGKIYTI